MAGNKLIRVFQGADGPNEVLQFRIIDHNGQVIDEPFIGTSHATLEIYGPNIVVDSRVNPEAIDWTLGGGKIELNLGAINVPPGAYRARLKVFNSVFVDGQVLTHEQGPNYLTIQFV